MTKTVKLTDRLQCIADYIEENQRIVDVGTDHGLVPIYLIQNEKTENVILSDIGDGPLTNALENIKKNELSGKITDLRCGNGLQTVNSDEVDVAIIAGMGGNLIIDILNEDIEKSRNIEFVLQPRKKQERLSYWLYRNGFTIIDETLVKESFYIWQIMKVIPQRDTSKKRYPYDFCINPVLIKKQDPLLCEFIEQKLKIEKNINSGAKDGKGWIADRNYEKSKIIIKYYEKLLNNLRS